MASGSAKVKASSGLNVRAGAGTQFAKLGLLSNGTQVTYYGETNGWLQISYQGKTGYICKDYLTITTQATSNSSGNTGGTSSNSAGSVKVTATTLNVRKGAGTTHAVIGTVSKGKVLTYTAESNGWYKINYNGQAGWISGTYAQKVTGGDQKPQQPQQPAGGDQQASTTKMYVTADTLNVRNAAGTSGTSVIGTLKRGSEVAVISTTNGWHKIKYNGGTAYISASYTSKDKPATGGGNGGGTNVSKSGWGWPIDAYNITSKFGPRSGLKLTNGKTSGSFHHGVDIAGGGGNAIRASKAGRATKYWDAGGYGNWIQIDHKDGTYTRYAHMSSTTVTGSQDVTQGQKIGVEGATGGVTGPHLHFEIRIGGTDKSNAVDPLNYIKH